MPVHVVRNRARRFPRRPFPIVFHVPRVRPLTAAEFREIAQVVRDYGTRVLVAEGGPEKIVPLTDR